VKISTTRFGEQEIEESKIIEVPDGMVGFSEDRFIILHPDNGPFSWFQAVDNPDLAFVVVDPTQFVPDYRVKLTQDEYDRLKIDAGDEVVLLSVVTMARDPRQITMNLQGPIVINPSRMIAKQIVLETVQAATRHPIFSNPTTVQDAVTESALRPTALSLVSSLFHDLGLSAACA
jgi:flagellar assembly factor FliW